VPTAIKNVWASGPRTEHATLRKDVITYGITPHPNDLTRRLMKLNFFVDENLEIGKSIIDTTLAPNRGSNYISNFCDVRLEAPDSGDRSAVTRHNRRVLAYRALLSKAGLSPPGSLRPSTQGLFNQDLRNALSSGAGKEPAAYASCATMLAKPNPSWAELAQCFA